MQTCRPTPTDRAAKIIDAAETPRDAANKLKAAGLLTPDVTDVQKGLDLDLYDSGVCVALQRTYVSLVADNDMGGGVLVTLHPEECRRLGAWLLAAAAEITGADQ